MKKKNLSEPIGSLKRSKLLFKMIVRAGLTGLISVMIIFTMVKAQPPATPYNPGETLNPTCAPGDPNCTVYPPAISTRLINTTSPLIGGGDLSADRTLSLITVPVSLGGTGATTAAGARTNLGATTVGGNLFTLTDPSAIRFLKINVDNTVSALTDADFRTAIGAGAGTVTSVALSMPDHFLVTGSPITTSGTLTASWVN